LSNKLNKLKAVYWVYIAIVCAYLIYGYVTGSGLYALLIDQQLRWFGKAQVEVAIFVPFIVLLLPILPVASYVRKKEISERLDDPKVAAAMAAGLRGPAAGPEKQSYLDLDRRLRRCSFPDIAGRLFLYDSHGCKRPEAADISYGFGRELRLARRRSKVYRDIRGSSAGFRL
jgi:hypothetical protein